MHGSCEAAAAVFDHVRTTRYGKFPTWTVEFGMSPQTSATSGPAPAHPESAMEKPHAAGPVAPGVGSVAASIISWGGGGVIWSIWVGTPSAGGQSGITT